MGFNSWLKGLTNDVKRTEKGDHVIFQHTHSTVIRQERPWKPTNTLQTGKIRGLSGLRTRLELGLVPITWLF